MSLHREYPHLVFNSSQWQLTREALVLLGQCEAYVVAVNNTPILPHHFEKLMQLALRKGAQATTAIEGNTLSDEEVQKIVEGQQKMPPSREYQERELMNIYNALNELLNEIIVEGKDCLITVELLKRFHVMVGRDLGDHFAAIPGQLRNADVVVGRYRCPDHRDVPELLDTFCKWLKTEFKFGQYQQSFSVVVIQAIVAHIYIEWIHPFNDGNGRTGRLVEFYLLLRGGFPNIASHILSNHYNLTRTEYYRQLENAKEKNNLTEFIEYALLGLRDGLKQTLEVIQRSQFENTWQKLIYEMFETIRESTTNEVFKRQRKLALNIPINKEFTLSEVPELSISVARIYAAKGTSEKTIARDIDKLIELNLVKRTGNKFSANTDIIRNYIPVKRRPLNVPPTK